LFEALIAFFFNDPSFVFLSSSECSVSDFSWPAQIINNGMQKLQNFEWNYFQLAHFEVTHYRERSCSARECIVSVCCIFPFQGFYKP
jgi:hypothetical protein